MITIFRYVKILQQIQQWNITSRNSINNNNNLKDKNVIHLRKSKKME